MFSIALCSYVGVIALGVRASYPMALFIPYARSISVFQNQVSSDDLSAWVCEDLLDLAEESVSIIRKKSFWLILMIWVIAFASFTLVLSLFI